MSEVQRLPLRPSIHIAGNDEANSYRNEEPNISEWSAYDGFRPIEVSQCSLIVYEIFQHIQPPEIMMARFSYSQFTHCTIFKSKILAFSYRITTPQRCLLLARLGFCLAVTRPAPCANSPSISSKSNCRMIKLG